MNQFHSGRDIHLIKYVVNVVSDGVPGDEQSICNVRIGIPLIDQIGHLPLPYRKGVLESQNIQNLLIRGHLFFLPDWTFSG
jgi:hypothetical protein